jgi:MFS family permease
MSFTAVSKVVAEIYDVETVIVNTCITLFFLAVLLISFPVASGLVKYGTRTLFKIVSIALIIGSWIRYFVLAQTGNFTIILIP